MDLHTFATFLATDKSMRACDLSWTTSLTFGRLQGVLMSSSRREFGQDKAIGKRRDRRNKADLLIEE